MDKTSPVSYTHLDVYKRQELQDKLHEIRFGEPQSVCGRLSPILSDESLFGLNLCETPLAARIEGMLMEELAGPGAVRAALRKYLTEDPA